MFNFHVYQDMALTSMISDDKCLLIFTGKYSLGLNGFHKLLLCQMGHVARKPVFGVSDNASFKPVSSATETS